MVISSALPFVSKTLLQPAPAADLSIVPRFPGSRILSHMSESGNVFFSCVSGNFIFTWSGFLKMPRDNKIPYINCNPTEILSILGALTVFYNIKMEVETSLNWCPTPKFYFFNGARKSWKLCFFIVHCRRKEFVGYSVILPPTVSARYNPICNTQHASFFFFSPFCNFY